MSLKQGEMAINMITGYSLNIMTICDYDLDMIVLYCLDSMFSDSLLTGNIFLNIHIYLKELILMCYFMY